MRVPLRAALLLLPLCAGWATGRSREIGDPATPTESLNPLFLKLRDAAGLAANEAWLDPTATNTPGVNAFFHAGTKKIVVTEDFMDCVEGNRGALEALAHEIGHAVQDRDGLLVEAPGANKPRQRKLEGQADHIGRELAFLANFPADLVEQSQGILAACRRQRFNLRGTTHPTDDDRDADAEKHLAPQRARDRVLAAVGSSMPGFHAPIPVVPSASGRAALAESAPRPSGRYAIPAKLALANFDDDGRLMGFDGPSTPLSARDCLTP